MNNFPEFWYESNACWGMVRSIGDLYEKCKLQIDRQYGGCRDIDEFLDRSLQYEDNLNFGTRREHTGDKTLRMFLIENGVDVSILYDIDRYNI